MSINLTIAQIAALTVDIGPITPAPTLDVALLRKQLEWATAEHAKAERGERSEWDQGTWCGTACCLAGHTALDTGWTFQVGVGPEDYTSQATKDGQVRHVRVVAEAALGLSHYQANVLFSAANTISDLWRIAAEVTKGEIEIPAGLPEMTE